MQNQHKQHEMYKLRRQNLVKLIKEQYPDVRSGVIMLIAGFEQSRYEFRQESSFYYFTGIEEPGIILLIDLDGQTTLYAPHYATDRAQWASDSVAPGTGQAEKRGVDTVEFLGKSVDGYVFPLLFNNDHVAFLVEKLKHVSQQGGVIFSLNNSNPRAYTEQKIALERLQSFMATKQEVKDIAAMVARLRRVKSRYEIEQLYKAVELTMIAQEGAAATLEEGKKEYEVQAGIEYVFREGNARLAFSSIVATGSNTVVLHYRAGTRSMKPQDLVVIDIGAEVNYYCADLTRTYPVSGTFTKRQREVYNIVLDAQEYIASIAAPGYWLNNKKEEKKSLNHLAQEYLGKKGYGAYFSHSIGHYLGLDVHDVGSYEEPLQENDVITIEPGIYLPEEGFGIRIEDDYWVIKDSVMCLSQDLAKDAETIEEMAQAELTLGEEADEEGFH